MEDADVPAQAQIKELSNGGEHTVPCPALHWSSFLPGRGVGVVRHGVPRELDDLGGVEGRDRGLHHGGRRRHGRAAHLLRRRDLRPVRRVDPRGPRAVVRVVRVPDHQRRVGRPEVAPGEQGQPLRRVRLRVQRARQGPQLQPGDERRPGAGVHQADLHGVVGDDGDGLGQHRGAGTGGGGVHGRPEVDAEVEVERRGAAEPVVVAVHEDGAEEVLGPRREGAERVAAARRAGEAAHVEVALGEGRGDVLGGDVVVGAGVGKAGVGNVGQPGAAVHVAALLRDAAVDADKPCVAQRTEMVFHGIVLARCAQ